MRIDARGDILILPTASCSSWLEGGRLEGKDDWWAEYEWDGFVSSHDLSDLAGQGILPKDTESFRLYRSELYDLVAEASGKTRLFEEVPNPGLYGDQSPGVIVPRFGMKLERRAGERVYEDYILDECTIGASSTRHNVGAETQRFEFKFHPGLVRRRQTSDSPVWAHVDWYLNAPHDDAAFHRFTERRFRSSFERLRGEQDFEGQRIANSGLDRPLRDHFLIETPIAKFVVARAEGARPSWSKRMGIEFRAEWGIPEDDVRTAIGEFVGFVLGKHLLPVGHTRIAQNLIVLEQAGWNPWGSNLMAECNRMETPPILLADRVPWTEIAERVIQKHLPMYLELRKRFGLDNALWRYWSSSALPIGTDVPLIVSAMEIVMAKWFEYPANSFDAVHVSEECFSTLLGDDLRPVEAKLQGVDRGTKVWNNIVRSYMMGQNDRLLAFFDRIGISIGKVEKRVIEARNRMIHGKVYAGEAVETALRFRWAADSFFNRVLLRLVGYEGKVVDRSTVPWSESDVMSPLAGPLPPA